MGDAVYQRQYRLSHPDYDRHHSERSRKYYCKVHGLPYEPKDKLISDSIVSYDDSAILPEHKPIGRPPKTKRVRTAVNTEGLKRHIMTQYGEGKLACVLCGITNLDCLTIDHINGDGGKERKSGLYHKPVPKGQHQPSGAYFYKWLVINGYPKGYRTLCMNCQLITYAEHRRKKKEESIANLLINQEYNIKNIKEEYEILSSPFGMVAP